LHCTRLRLDRLSARLVARPEDRFARQREAEWERGLETRLAFLEHIPEELVAEVAAALADPDGDEHLASWVLWPVAQGAELPATVPTALVRVMLDHPEASLLHECERCGLKVPIRPGLQQPFKPAVVLFPTCPACGGRTGYYAYSHVRRSAR
jgi:hypothetical protein